MGNLTYSPDKSRVILDTLKKTGIPIHPDLWAERLRWYRKTQSVTRIESSFSQHLDVLPYLSTSGRTAADWTRLPSTMRYTAAKPSLQGIPKLLREAVGTPSTKWASGDWTAAHPSILATAAEDSSLHADIKTGKVYDIPGLSRELGKIEVLKIINGGASPHRIPWADRYPITGRFIGSVHKSASASGRVGALGVYVDVKNAPPHAALGRLLQCIESHAVTHAAFELVGQGLRLIMHDEVVLEFDPGIQDETVTLAAIRDTMTAGMEAVGVPGVTVRCRSGNNWGMTEFSVADFPSTRPFNWGERSEAVCAAIGRRETVTTSDICVAHLHSPQFLADAAAGLGRDEARRITGVIAELKRKVKAAKKGAMTDEEAEDGKTELERANCRTISEMIGAELERSGPLVSDSKLSTSEVYRYNGASWEPICRTRFDAASLALQGRYIVGKQALNLKPRDADDARKNLVAARDRMGFFSNSSRLIAFENGTLSADGVFLPHTPDVGLLSTDVREFPYRQNQQPKRFLRFLDEVWAGDDDREEKTNLLQEWLGSCIFGEVTREAGFCLLFLGRSASNGKSVLTSVISDLFPQTQVQETTLGALSGSKAEYYAAKLRFARLCVQRDSGNQTITETGLFKQLMTGDGIVAREPGGKPFSFRAQAGWIVCANELPRFSEVGPAISRRIAVMRFDRVFAGESDDKELLPKLLEERPAIVEWARQGHERVKLARGVNMPGSTSFARLQTADHYDMIYRFAEEYNLGWPTKSTEESITHYVGLGVLYTLFVRWYSNTVYLPEDKPHKQLFRMVMHEALGYWYGRLPKPLSPNRDWGFGFDQTKEGGLTEVFKPKPVPTWLKRARDEGRII